MRQHHVRFFLFELVLTLNLVLFSYTAATRQSLSSTPAAMGKSTGNISANQLSTNNAATTRPRPQPIAGTPPPDPSEKCDSKIIQQTCTLFGLDLVIIILFLLINIPDLLIFSLII